MQGGAAARDAFGFHGSGIAVAACMGSRTWGKKEKERQNRAGDTFFLVVRSTSRREESIILIDKSRGGGGEGNFKR